MFDSRSAQPRRRRSGRERDRRGRLVDRAAVSRRHTPKRTLFGAITFVALVFSLFAAATTSPTTAWAAPPSSAARRPAPPSSKLVIGLVVGVGLGLLTVAGVGLMSQRRR